MTTGAESPYERLLAERAMNLAIKASSQINAHETLCAERYRWLTLWVKCTAIIVAASTVSLIAAMWQLLIKLSHLG